MILIISCSLTSSIIIYYAYTETKKYLINEKKKKLDKRLPQIYGCNHKKCSNTYFYEDKIYCQFCWDYINKSKQRKKIKLSRSCKELYSVFIS